MTTAYFAGPLFTSAERRFNQELSQAILTRCEFLKIILPQQIGAEIAGAADFTAQMFRHAIESLEKCDLIIAILDGADADSGTCIELGYAWARGKPIIGIRTDFREGEDHGMNLMVSNVCAKLIFGPSTQTSLDDLADRTVEALRSISTVRLSKSELTRS